MIKELTLLIGLSITIVANAIETRLAYSKKDEVEVFVTSNTEKWCASDINLKFVGRDSAYYQSRDFINLFNKLRSIIPGECANVKSITVVAFNSNKSKQLYQANSTEINGWRLVANKLDTETIEVIDKKSEETEIIDKNEGELVLSNSNSNNKIEDQLVKPELLNWEFNGWKPEIINLTDNIKSLDLFSIKTKDKACTLYFPTYPSPDEIDFLYLIPSEGVICTNSGVLKGKGSVFINYIDGTRKKEINGYFDYGMAFSTEVNSQLDFVPITVKKGSYGYTSAILDKVNDLGGIILASLYWDKSRLRWYLEERVDVMLLNPEVITDEEKISRLVALAGAAYNSIYPKQTSLRFRAWLGYKRVIDNEQVIFDDNYRNNSDYLYSSHISRKKDKSWVNSRQENFYLSRLIEQKKVESEKAAELIAKEKQQEAINKENISEQERIKALKEKIAINPLLESKLEFTIAGKKPQYYLVEDLIKDLTKQYDGSILWDENKECSLYFINKNFGSESEFLQLIAKEGVVCRDGFFTGQGTVIIQYSDGRQFDKIKGYFAYGTTFDRKILSQQEFIGDDKNGYNDIYLVYELASLTDNTYAFDIITWSRSNYTWNNNDTLNILYKGDNSIFLSKEYIETDFIPLLDAYIKETEINFNINYSRYLRVVVYDDYEVKNKYGKWISYDKNLTGLFSQNFHYKKNRWQIDGKYTNYYIPRQIAEKKAEERRKEEAEKKRIREEKKIAEQHKRAEEERKRQKEIELKRATFYIDCYKRMEQFITQNAIKSDTWIYKFTLKLMGTDTVTLDSTKCIAGEEIDSLENNPFMYKKFSSVVNVTIAENNTIKISWPTYFNITDPKQFISSDGWQLITGQSSYTEDKLKLGLYRPDIEVNKIPYMCIESKCGEIFNIDFLIKKLFVDLEKAKAIMENKE